MESRIWVKIYLAVQNYSCCILLDINFFLVSNYYHTFILHKAYASNSRYYSLIVFFLSEPRIAINSSNYLRFLLLQLAELGVGSYWSGLV